MKAVFNKKQKTLIGMIHLPPTMGYKGWPGIDLFIKHALNDLLALEKGGIDAALIENDGDNPCKVLGTSDVVVPMAIVAKELRKVARIPLGVEVLLNDPKASLTIAKTCNLDFIRTDYFVDRMTRDGYGEFEIDPAGVIGFRNKIGASGVSIYADVQVKYATLVKEKSLGKSVTEAISYGADGVIVSGKETGVGPETTDVIEAKKTAKDRVPVIIGSGLSVDNAKELMRVADWAIVGSSIKTKGVVDIQKVKKLVKIVKEL